MFNPLSFITEQYQLIHSNIFEEKYSLPEFIVDCLNSSHKHKFDSFVSNEKFKIGHLIYSRVKAVKLSTFFLEIYVPIDWNKDINQTAIQFLNDWFSQHKELQKCSYYEVNIYNKESPSSVIYTSDYEATIIYKMALNYDFREEVNHIYKHTNKTERKSLKTCLKRFKSCNGDIMVYKFYMDLDMSFFNFNLDSFIHHKSYNEDDFYSNEIKGLPTFIRFQLPNNNGYEEFPILDKSKLELGRKYAIMICKHTSTITTKSIAHIQNEILSEIKIFKMTFNRKLKVIARINKRNLKEFNSIK